MKLTPEGLSRSERFWMRMSEMVRGQAIRWLIGGDHEHGCPWGSPKECAYHVKRCFGLFPEGDKTFRAEGHCPCEIFSVQAVTDRIQSLSGVQRGSQDNAAFDDSREDQDYGGAAGLVQMQINF